MSAQDIGEKYDILRLLIMSIPFYTILCTSCDFNDGYSYGILYEYQGPDDHEPALQLAWCQDCDKIVSVCSPYTQELAGEMIANLQKEIAWNRAGFFARFSKRKRHAIEEAEHKIEITRKRVCYFGNDSSEKITNNNCENGIFSFSSTSSKNRYAVTEGFAFRSNEGHR